VIGTFTAASLPFVQVLSSCADELAGMASPRPSPRRA
jgi:hypothetical protein